MSLTGKIIKRFFPKAIRQEIAAKSAEQAAQIAGGAVQRIKAQVGFGSGYVVHGPASGRGDGSKYPLGLSGSGAALNLDHYRLRQNARLAFHDTPQARALVERYADTVADIGLTLEAAPKSEILGITPEQAEAWGRDVEERFDLFAKSKRQHRAENMTWYQSHRLYQIFQHRDNDIFVRLYYSPDTALLNPLQFDFMDANQIRGDAFTSTEGAGMCEDGIDRDERGREKTYKIWYTDAAGKIKNADIPRIGPKSGRIMMLHGFNPEYAGQGRGYSRLAFALQEFQNLTDFSLAQVKKAINQSQIVLYVKPSQDKPASNPLAGLLSAGGAGPAASQFGADPTPSPDAENVTAGNPVSFYSLPEATMDTPGSTSVFNLEAGEDLKAFENKVAAESYNVFVDAFTSYLSAATSMPLEVLLMKFNQNYSASRACLILFWRVACIWREEMAADYLNPCYEMWLAGEIAARRIKAPGWENPYMRAAWLNCNWIGSPMPNIDPARTMTADKGYVEMGAQSLDRVAKNLNGSSGKANRAKLKREVSELTVPPWSKGATNAGNNRGRTE